MTTAIVIGVIVLLAFYLVAIYNKLIALLNQYKNGFAQIEVQLKRRYDLIPNLVETAKGYLKHESETLEKVIAARNTAVNHLKEAQANPENAKAMADLNHAENGLAQAMGGFNLVMEDYPDLKANENMMKLHEELATTENRIAFARQAYNDFAMAYNTYRQSFPNIIIANNTGHTNDVTLLEFADSQAIQEVVKVSF